MTRPEFQVGDWVIYRKSKQSTQPGPRAEGIKPFEKGDGYAYTVDKYWVVAEVRDDGHLLLRTRRGKEHVIAPDDPALHKANWWQRWRRRKRFEEVEAGDANE